MTKRIGPIPAVCVSCGSDYIRGRGCSPTKCPKCFVRPAIAAIPKLSIEERFERMVIRRGPDECWGWRGAAHNGGYGHLDIGDGGQEGAHRISYRMHKGPIASGLVVRHSCDNPICTNPAHLSLGTPADNTRDRDERGRAARGERIPLSKLTEDAVRDIRQNVDPEQWGSFSAFARKYGVSRRTVRTAYYRETWGHIA